jgi:hypothetical protein
MDATSSVPRVRRALLASLALLSVCQVICTAAPARAQTSANSSAFGVDVNLLLDPPLGSNVPITLGPLPAGVMGSGTSAYSVSDFVLSATLSPAETGEILTTGVLIGTASALLPIEQSDGAATVDDLDVTIVGGLLVPIIELTATTVQSTGQATGTCAAGILNRAGTTTLTNAEISILGAPAVPISANPAPNTLLLAATLGPLGITVTLNEQIPSGDGTTFAGITVRAIHINLNVDLGLLGVLTGDIIIAESQAELVCAAAQPTDTSTITPTGTATGTASATATATATGTAAGTASATTTGTVTGTATTTGTVTSTRTAAATPTPGPPIIDPPLNPGDTRVPGSGPPGRADGQIFICLIGGPDPTMPNVPPCQGPDTNIGMCGTTGAGAFIDNGSPGCLVPPLQIGQCVYAFDTVTMLISNVVCVAPPAPAPALSAQMIVVALALLTAIAGVSLQRLRRQRGEGAHGPP